jgi:hypothetical protein
MSGDVFALLTVIPRGAASGASVLVSVTDDLEVSAIRTFGVHEYLTEPHAEPDPPIEHCRGLARVGGTLFVAMFDAVRTYTIASAEHLQLRPGRRYTHPCCVDVHGIAVVGDRLMAASTGTDAVISWNLPSGSAHVESLAPASGADRERRWPKRRARRMGATDWRAALAPALHVNGVMPLGDDDMLISHLGGLQVRDWDGALSTLVDAPGRLVHDGQLADDDKVLATDASRGRLLVVDRETGALLAQPAIADPRRWFVRGLMVTEGGHALVLRSAVTATAQRRVDADPAGGGEASGALVGLTVVDLASLRIVSERDIRLDAVSRGSVAYAAVPAGRTSSLAAHSTRPAGVVNVEAHIAAMEAT